MLYNCEYCQIRKRAEARPRSLLALLWRLHIKVCPGWKAYKKNYELRFTNYEYKIKS